VIDLAAERFTKNLWTERQSAERPQLVSVRDEADQDPLHRRARAREPGGRHFSEIIGDHRGDRLKHFEAAQASAISRTDRRNGHHHRVTAVRSGTEVHFCQREVSSRKSSKTGSWSIGSHPQRRSKPMSSLAWQRAFTPRHSPRF
jgi:hypothetical protein